MVQTVDTHSGGDAARHFGAGRDREAVRAKNAGRVIGVPRDFLERGDAISDGQSRLKPIVRITA